MDDLNNTLRTMANAVAKQVRHSIDIFLSRDMDRIPRLIEKDGYINQLNNIVDQRTFHELSKRKIEPFVARYYRGVIKVSVNLEKIGDYAANVARQTQHLSGKLDGQLAQRFGNMAAKVETAVKVSVDAFLQGDWDLASAIAEVEYYLDSEYARCIHDSEKLFEKGRLEIRNLITTILVAKYLEKMGDSLQNIAEVAISMASGERLKVHQLDNLRSVSGGTKLTFRSADGGISGAFTGIVEDGDGSRYFYKEGSLAVIQDEVAKSKVWNGILAGIVPEVHRVVFDENSEGYLMDYLEGRLFQDLLAEPGAPKKEVAARKILEVLRRVWDKTLKKELPKVDYVDQIRKRSADLFATHPKLEALRDKPMCVGGIQLRSLVEMLDLAQTYQPRFEPSFSVYIHGDFNSNNIFFDPETDEIHFIDVHRSGSGDYLTDLGTLMVSNLRYPRITADIRGDIYTANRLLYEFGREYAAKHGDEHFDKRLDLVLARNYITSGRNFADLEHARDLFLRGLYCLERFLA